jgi:hypothetical protein
MQLPICNELVKLAYFLLCSMEIGLGYKYLFFLRCKYIFTL